MFRMFLFAVMFGDYILVERNIARRERDLGGAKRSRRSGHPGTHECVRYRPPTVISPTTNVGAAIDPRNSRSDPTASRFISICCRVPALVTSETGNASAPSRIHRPTAPRE